MELVCCSNIDAACNEEAVTGHIRGATAGVDQRPWELQWLLSRTEVGLSQLAYVVLDIKPALGDFLFHLDLSFKL